MQIIIFNITPIAILLKNCLEEGEANPKRIIEIGLMRIYGYALALEGFAPFFNEIFTLSIGKILDRLEEINYAYSTASDPSRYLPLQKDIKEMSEWMITLSAQSLDIDSKDFITAFHSTVQFLNEKLLKGSPSLDEVYAVQGVADAFGQMDHCHSIPAYKHLVQHLDQYANAWPAKFALQDLRGCLKELKAA